eukprot:scaffold42046_cov41-Prasinocladus_malaysianus.AAC.1
MSGEQGLEFITWRYQAFGFSGVPKIVLMDLMMPGIDGLETTRRMRQQSYMQEVPILMISAKSLEET